MERRKIIFKVCLLSVILVMNVVFIPGIANTPFLMGYFQEDNLSKTLNGDIKEKERGTRGIESYDWPMFHQNVYRTGAADPSITAPDNETAYLFDSGGDIESTPAIVGDWVFFGQSLAPLGDYSFYGLNETDGWYWKFNTTENWAWRSSPAVADIPGIGLMVFTGQSSGASNRFYGFDADPDDNNDGVIDALDNDEGKDDPVGAEYDIIWDTQLTSGFYRHSPLVADIPALGGYVIYMGSNDGNVTCMSASDGMVIWRWDDPTGEGFQYSHPTLGYNVLGNPMVFIINDGAAQNTIYALDAVGAVGTTTVRWQSNVQGNDVRSGPSLELGTPGANDDRLYFVTWDSNPTLYCMDATPDDNGNLIVGDLGDIDEGVFDLPSSQYDLIWSYELVTGAYAAGSPALHNGNVYIGVADIGEVDNTLFAIAQNTTEDHTHVVWTYHAPGDMYWSSPIVADGKVIVTTRGYWGLPGLAVVNENDGTEVWFNTDLFSGDIETSCSIANGRIYVGGDDNILHVFGAPGRINKKPYPPDLYSPLNYDIVNSSSPRLDWSDAIDIDGYVIQYEIEIDDNSDFSSPEYSVLDLTSSHYFPSFIADGLYFWRVRAVDNDSAHSIWSDVWRFTVDTINDAPVITVLSPNGGEVWAGVHDIWWSAYDSENEPMTFEVWLSDDSGLNYDILLASYVVSQVREWRFETTVFPDGDTYRVMVNATDNQGLKSVDTSDADFSIDNTNGIIYDDWPQFHKYANNTGFSPSQAPETNNTNWIFYTTREIDASPAIYGGLVFIGDHNGSFWALDETTGELIWRYDHTDVWSWCDTSPAIGYSNTFNTNVVFFGLTISDGYNFFAMDLEGMSDGDEGIMEGDLPANINFNADVLWAYKAEGSGALSSSPTVHNDTVYIGFYETELWIDNSSLFAFDVNGYFDGDDGTDDDELSPDFMYADILWRYDTHSMAVTSTPAVENVPSLGDVVFVGTDEGYWTSDAGNPNFFALDADPFDDPVDQGAVDPIGAEYDLIWEVHLDDYIFSSPAVAYGNVYVGTYSSPDYNPDNPGYLYCLDAETGGITWSFPVGANNDIYASPAVWNDTVYIPSRTGDSSVYALDATPEDGVDEGYDDPIAVSYDIIWIHDLYASKITSSPALANGRLYIGAGWEYSWGEMYCLDAVGNGVGSTKEIWAYETSDFVFGSPSVSNGCVWATDTEGYVYKFGAVNGTDLAIQHKDVTFSLPTPQENNTAVTIQAKVTNLGNIDAMNVMVRFFDDLNENEVMDPGEQIGTDQIIGLIAAYGNGTASVIWTAQPIGYHNIYVTVDPLNSIEEVKENNNQAWTFYAVEAKTYEIDYIIIRTQPNGGGIWVGDRIYQIAETDTFYCAGYNQSVGFQRDVSADWVCNDTSIATVSSPGKSSIFTTSDVNSGFVYVTATYNSITNKTGILTVLSPDVDNIIIRDAPSGGGSWVSGRSYGVGEIDTFYCAGYNQTTGNYVRDVQAQWVSNNTLLATVTSPGTSTILTVNMSNYGILFVRATYNGLFTNDTGPIIVIQPCLDYIIIRSEPNGLGEEIGEGIYGIGDSDTFYCAGYNLTASYIQDVSADWDCNDTSIASVTSPGINTTFTVSTSSWGVVMITATYNTLTDTTGSITILEPTVDYIIIRNQPGNTGQWVGDRIYVAGGSEIFYCAGYNNTYDYIDDFSADWSSTNPTKGEVTTPGESTTFTASSVSFGDVYVTATYNGKTNQTGKLTILAPTLDYLLIRDEADNGGEVVNARTYAVGDTDTFYCAGYNSSSGYLGDFSADWLSTDDSIGEVAPSGESTTFTASGTKSGSVTVTASYSGLEASTGLLTVTPPTVDSIVVRDEPDNGGVIVGSRTYRVGDTDRFYCAGYNNTAGYIGDFSASWESSDSSIGHVTSYGEYTTFTASSTNSGTLTVTAAYGGKTDSTGILTVLAPIVDYVIIKDVNGNGVEGLTIGLGESIVLYCAGYNNTAGFIGNIEVVWESLNSSVATVGSPGSSTTFQSSDDTPGQTLISVDYQGRILGTANIKVEDDVPPTADAGEDQTIKKDETVQLDGTGSEDNVEIENYTWTFYEEGDLVTLDGQLPDYEFTKSGTYDITLTVTDTSGNSDTDTVIVIVEGEDVEEGFGLWWLVILIIVIILIAILLFLFLTKKKKSKGICKNCGQAFYPQNETEATLGLCPNCALKGAQPPSVTSRVLPPPPPGMVKQTKRIKCPSCKKDFDVEVTGSGAMTVTCPHCGTSGQMNF